MRSLLLVGNLFVVLMAWYGTATGEIITSLPTREKVVALTFDGCESKTAALIDRGIVKFIVEEQIPCSIFVGGKFAVRNRTELAELSKLETIRLHNHSWSHYQHMETLKPDVFEKEVSETGQLIEEITGKRPDYFRFPAGNYDARSLKAVEALGYKVVHWTFPSGDPDKGVSADRLFKWVLSQTREGSILIFHINGRGYHTAEALPRIVRDLRRKGYRFVALDDLINGR